jgi:hypothetical protein
LLLSLGICSSTRLKELPRVTLGGGNCPQYGAAIDRSCWFDSYDGVYWVDVEIGELTFKNQPQYLLYQFDEAQSFPRVSGSAVRLEQLNL